MACTLPACFLVVTMQRAVGFSRRAQVLTAGGGVTALACYLTGAKIPPGAALGGGSGLIGLRDRVEPLGGDLQITSPPTKARHC